MCKYAAFGGVSTNNVLHCRDQYSETQAFNCKRSFNKVLNINIFFGDIPDAPLARPWQSADIPGLAYSILQKTQSINLHHKIIQIYTRLGMLDTKKNYFSNNLVCLCTVLDEIHQRIESILTKLIMNVL